MFAAFQAMDVLQENPQTNRRDSLLRDQRLDLHRRQHSSDVASFKQRGSASAQLQHEGFRLAEIYG